MAETNIRSLSDAALHTRGAQDKLESELTELERISSGISQVTSGIGRIADQTNLLAPNAAVDAIARIRAVAGQTVDTTQQMARQSIAAAEKIATMSADTEEERRKISVCLSNLKDMARQRDAMRDSVEQITLLGKLATA